MGLGRSLLWHKLDESVESFLQLERDCSQRRLVNDDGMLAAHPLVSFAVDAAEIPYVAAAVRFAIGVDDLAVETGPRLFKECQQAKLGCAAAAKQQTCRPSAARPTEDRT